MLLCCALIAGCGSGSRTDDTQASASASTADILVQHCSACHAPPSPKLHSKDEWPRVVARMERHRLDGRLPALSTQEQDEVVAYLQAHAK
ncbi:MAG TPA: hypothetical protein VJ961_04440 [Mariprofundaceae bacterium]|nr:hypothetical protein [Mariprofundaceae bacterium]